MRSPVRIAGASGFWGDRNDALLDPVRGVRVVTNAGGMNPRACAEAVVELARKQGHTELRVGLVEGDDIADSLGALADAGVALANMDTGAAFSTIRERVMSANVYFGADPIAEALHQGAQIVVTGPCTDSALALRSRSPATSSSPGTRRSAGS
jgi:phage terminase large subunit-like protein